MVERARRRAATKLGIALIAIGVAPALFAEGDRLVVNVPGPFEVLGHVYQTGVLAVRQIGVYNPTTTMHSISIGTDCLGVFLARHEIEAGTLLVDVLVFERSRRGLWSLVGYEAAGASAGRHDVFSFRSPAIGDSLDSTTPEPGRPAPTERGTSP